MKIIPLVVTAVIVVAIVIIKTYVNMKISYGDVLDKTYVCPNCGHKFQPEWYQMLYRAGTVYVYDCAKLKCPNCHERDMCHVSHDLDS